jgi:3D (Asp-Asp-Asp) domain-containing protein
MKKIISYIKEPELIYIVAMILIVTFTSGAAVGYSAFAIPKAHKEAATEQTTSQKSMYEIISEQDGEPWLVSLGKFTITAYCPCAACCGKTDGITASGTKAREGRTIAVDPNLIPYGTELVINGNTYIAEDTGGSVKGHKLDIFFNSHLEALEWGVQEHEVFIYD